MYLAGLALGSPEGTAPMTALALGVVSTGLISAVLWTKLVGGKVRERIENLEKREGEREELLAELIPAMEARGHDTQAVKAVLSS